MGDINKCFLAMGIQELHVPKKWESMTELAGDYIEGMQTQNVSIFDHILEIGQLVICILQMNKSKTL